MRSARWLTVRYKVINEAAREIAGQACIQRLPTHGGSVFQQDKLLLFHGAALKAGETREMTVVFYVDPPLVKDSDQADLNTITLSYTFYRLRELDQPVAEAPKKNSSRL